MLQSQLYWFRRLRVRWIRWGRCEASHMAREAHIPSSPTKDLQGASRVLHIQARVMGRLVLRDTQWPCRVACSMANRSVIPNT